MISAWKSAVIASGGTLSAEVDLGKDYKRVLVIAPTIDSATINVSSYCLWWYLLFNVHIRC